MRNRERSQETTSAPALSAKNLIGPHEPLWPFPPRAACGSPLLRMCKCCGCAAGGGSSPPSPLEPPTMGLPRSGACREQRHRSHHRRPAACRHEPPVVPEGNNQGSAGRPAGEHRLQHHAALPALRQPQAATDIAPWCLPSTMSSPPTSRAPTRPYRCYVARPGGPPPTSAATSITPTTSRQPPSGGTQRCLPR